MDLFAPNPEVNTYGARNKKNVSILVSDCFCKTCNTLTFLLHIAQSWSYPTWQVVRTSWIDGGAVQESPCGGSKEKGARLPEECGQGLQVPGF